MIASSGPGPAARLSLRDRLRAPYAEREDPHPLVQLGAVYRLAQQAATADDTDLFLIKDRLVACIERAEEAGANHDNVEMAEFSLHAAMCLANLGDFEGVQWILRVARARNPEIRQLAVLSLACCRRFPITGPVADAFDLNVPGVPTDVALKLISDLESLLRHADDDFVGDSSAEPGARSSLVDELVMQIDRLRGFPRVPDREIGMGAVLTRPWTGESRPPRTGFAVTELDRNAPRVVGYDRATTLYLDQRPTRRVNGKWQPPPPCWAILAYSKDDNCLARVVCGIPSGAIDDEQIGSLMTRLAMGCVGATVRVVADVAPSAYHLVSASGDSGLARHEPAERSVGECFVYHEENPFPLAVGHVLGQSALRDTLRRFIETTETDMAVEIGHAGNRHQMVSRLGSAFGHFGNIPPYPVHMVDNTPRGPMMWALPDDAWLPEDRTRVLAGFSEQLPDAFGVVLDTNVGADGQARARIVRFRDPASARFIPVPPTIDPGTVVLWVINEKKAVVPILVPDHRILGGCLDCFSSGVRVCPDCSGTGSVVCSVCHGTKEEPCWGCDGGGEIEWVCEVCSGSGTWQGVCGGCQGSGTFQGTCRVCEGTGQYADTGRPCKKCSGAGTFEAECRRCSGQGTFSGPCNRCRGEGRRLFECRTCRRSGRAGCRNCQRSGQTKCPRCASLRVAPCECEGADRGRLSPV